MGIYSWSLESLNAGSTGPAALDRPRQTARQPPPRRSPARRPRRETIEPVELVRLQVEHEALGEEAVAWTGYGATTLAELPRKAALRSMAGDHMAGGTAEYAWSL